MIDLTQINKMSKIVEHNYKPTTEQSTQEKIIDDLKVIAALLHELAMDKYLEED